MLWLEWWEQGRVRRYPLTGPIRIARAHDAEIALLHDPWASRQAVLVHPNGTSVALDGARTSNGVVVRNQLLRAATVRAGDCFAVGSTEFRVVFAEPGAETLKIGQAPLSELCFRMASRELYSPAGELIARLSSLEALAFLPVVRAHPNIASHEAVGESVWGRDAWDQYQVHRLMQRLRARLGEAGEHLENVRGAGYRFGLPVTLA